MAEYLKEHIIQISPRSRRKTDRAPEELGAKTWSFPITSEGSLGFQSRPIRCGGTLGMGIKTIWLDVAFRLHGSVDIICIPQQSCSGPVQDATGESVSYCALGPSTRYLGKHSMVSIEYLT